MAEQPEKSGLYTNTDRKTAAPQTPARKRGVPWWAWLIGALVILALLWWFLSGGTQEPVVVEPTDGAGETLEPATPAPQ